MVKSFAWQFFFLMLLGCTHQSARRMVAGGGVEYPNLDFSVQVGSIDEGDITESGRVAGNCDGPISIRLPLGSDFIFRNGLLSKDGRIAHASCTEGRFELSFQGKLPLPKGRCAYSTDEIYCLNNSAPNPETESARSYYNVTFNLPQDFSSLAPDSELTLPQGFQFQIARLADVRETTMSGLKFSYILPKGFEANPSYLHFLESSLVFYQTIFGKLPFSKVKIGAIRRGGNKEASGSPAGNLILFSRTALGDDINQGGLSAIGISIDVSDALRKLVIAHELSHFWFGDRYSGHDGWMVEGIPQYLGLVRTIKSNSKQGHELLKLFTYMDKKGDQGPIPNKPFGDGALFINAYYQGPLALHRIGESIGHTNLVKLIANVFKETSNPTFSDFEQYFMRNYADKAEVWRKAWRL